MRERNRDESGVIGFEALPLLVLAFVVGSLFVLRAWAVVDAKMSVRAAARVATREIVEADPASGFHGAARQAERAARAVVRGHGRNPQRVAVVVEPTAGDLTRCRRVVVTVSEIVDVEPVVWLGPARSIEVRGDHSEIVDPYRSGLTGEADCAR